MLIINTEKQFLKALTDNITKNVVIHYTCPMCKDDQVTYEEEAQDIFETFSEYEYLVTGYECTHCGSNIKMIHLEDIDGIEIM